MEKLRRMRYYFRSGNLTFKDNYTQYRSIKKKKLDLIQVLKWIYGPLVLLTQLPCLAEEAGLDCLSKREALSQTEGSGSLLPRSSTWETCSPDPLGKQKPRRGVVCGGPSFYANRSVEPAPPGQGLCEPRTSSVPRLNLHKKTIKVLCCNAENPDCSLLLYKCDFSHRLYAEITHP